MRRVALLLLVLAGAAPAQASGAAPPRPASATLADRHPAELMRSAAQLFKAGAREDAVFWFYLGQLRYRAYLQARPDLPRSGEPALFASLMEVVGRPINQHAFGDVGELARILDRVLAFDAAHEDRLTPKDRHGALREGVRYGLVQMRDEALAKGDEIRATRLRNGLTNR